jgi:tungstate transport system ATP-binding protein
MMNNAAFTLRNVEKDFGSVFQLAVERLDIIQGETLAIVGPTGAGKSTLLRLLAGLESPSRGEIRYRDAHLMSPNAPLPIRREIAMVHQRPLLLSGSVRSNVEYGLSLRGVTAPYPRATAALALLGLGGMAARNARKLSVGQTQLVAIARAIVLAPEVLLLDEPTSSLDPAHVELVETAARAVQADRPMTIVWSTHNLFQARRVADRVAFLWNGELIEAAPTEDIFERPTDRRTADFVKGRTVW